MQRNTRERYYQIASEDKKSPKSYKKMPYSCHGLLHKSKKCYFSQNFTIRLFFSYLHPFLNIIIHVLCKTLKGNIFLAFFFAKTQSELGNKNSGTT